MRILIVVLTACLFAGCSLHSTAKIARFEHESIHVVIKADPQLNLFDKNAHALILCLYQLKDPSGFRQLSRERDGRARLLECTPFDNTVTDARQLVLQPGQELQQQGASDPAARYLGVATGYYSFGNNKVTELSLFSTGKRGAATGRRVLIELGPQEIRNVRVE